MDISIITNDAIDCNFIADIGPPATTRLLKRSMESSDIRVGVSHGTRSHTRRSICMKGGCTATYRLLYKRDDSDRSTGALL
jgi:hypothetical protein